MSSHIRARNILLIIFVNGMFTTFIAGLFTNTSHAIREIRAMSCV
ncbi:putative membrane protein [Bradyrhizobium sp. AZCC 1719]